MMWAPNTGQSSRWTAMVKSHSLRTRCWWTIELNCGFLSQTVTYFGTESGAKAKAERIIAQREATAWTLTERSFEVGS